MDAQPPACVTRWASAAHRSEASEVVYDNLSLRETGGQPLDRRGVGREVGAQHAAAHPEVAAHTEDCPARLVIELGTLLRPESGIDPDPDIAGRIVQILHRACCYLLRWRCCSLRGDGGCHGDRSRAFCRTHVHGVRTEVPDAHSNTHTHTQITTPHTRASRARGGGPGKVRDRSGACP